MISLVSVPCHVMLQQRVHRPHLCQLRFLGCAGGGLEMEAPCHCPGEGLNSQKTLKEWFLP